MKTIELKPQLVSEPSAIKPNTCLLVRDDSVLLNKSVNNLSTSSITEVSSLMPSRQCGTTILNATNLSENLHLEDEEGSYRRLTLNNRSNRSSRLFYESNSGGIAPFFFNDKPFSEHDALSQLTTSQLNRQSVRSSCGIKVQTIGEIMEPAHHQKIPTSVNQINDSSASSFASTGDSGRDSIESPVNNVQQTNKHVLTSSISQNSCSSRPFIVGLQTKSPPNSLIDQSQFNNNAFFLNPSQNKNNETILRLSQSSHILDTRC